VRRALLCVFSGLIVCALFSTAALAASHSTADYSLRVHIYQFNSHSHYYGPQYYGQKVDYVDGEGRANLFENGEPRGFDFGYRCGARLMSSAGYETYFARWKKPGKALEILLPQFGKPGAFDTCELKVEMKENSVYHRHNGLLSEEPASKYKEWMEKVQYDPEHGKNEPVVVPGVGPGAGD
jgi:hypothetical protein